MTESNIELVMKKYGKLIPKKKRELLKRELVIASDDSFDTIMSTPTKNLHLTHVLSIVLGPLGVDRIYLGDSGTGVLKIALGVLAIGVKLGYDVEITQKNNDIGQYGWAIPALLGAYGLFIVADVAFAYMKAKNINADLILSAASDSYYARKDAGVEESNDGAAETV